MKFAEKSRCPSMPPRARIEEKERVSSLERIATASSHSMVSSGSRARHAEMTFFFSAFRRIERHLFRALSTFLYQAWVSESLLFVLFFSFFPIFPYSMSKASTMLLGWFAADAARSRNSRPFLLSLFLLPISFRNTTISRIVFGARGISGIS
ncbi:hypothetical protein SDC9_205665 [bioreactor metagenome]|uniref:Transmembrane protein n=1 Tax=bioreactor metagenome TaxID=1076179 RepID=A0A645J5I8_9ZZZZ